jgi:hypothetical protein
VAPLWIAWTFREVGAAGLCGVTLLAWLCTAMPGALCARCLLRRRLLSIQRGCMIGDLPGTAPAEDRQHPRALMRWRLSAQLGAE